MSPGRVGDVLRDLRRYARRSDVLVVSAAMTCFAAFGLVPLAAISVRVAASVYGAGAVTKAAADVAPHLRGPLGLDRDLVAFAHAGAGAAWWTIIVALLPVSLYAEGTVRCLERFSRAPEHRSRRLRGRLLTPVLVVFGTAAVLVIVGPLRRLSQPFGTGTGASLLGLLVAFNVLFFFWFAALLLVYRLFASTPLRRGPLVVGAFAAASWISGQLIGYTFALRVVSGFDRAFGGYAPAGEVAAVAFLVYLEHVVFVLGYLLALVLHDRGERVRAGGQRSAARASSSSTTTGRWSDTGNDGVETVTVTKRVDGSRTRT